MGKRKHTATQPLRKSRVEKRYLSTLFILGSVVLLSLSFCPAVLMMSTAGGEEPVISASPVKLEGIPLDSESSIPPPSSRIGLDKDDLPESPATNTSNPDLTLSNQNHEEDDEKPAKQSELPDDTSSIPAELLELLGDDDMLAVSLDSIFPAGLPFSLENVNSSVLQGALGERLLQRLAQSSSSTSNSSEDANTLRNLTAGVFSGSGVLSSFLSQDDLYVIPKKMLVETFSTAEESWLSTRKMLDERFAKTQGADSKSPIGTAFAFNAPNEESIALSNSSSLLEYASREFLRNLENADGKQVQRRKRSTLSNNSPILFEDVDSDLVLREDIIDLDSVHTRFIRQSLNSMNGPASTCGLNEETLPCNTQSKFRTFSGFCNNIRHPAWGKSVITFDRMVDSMYDDGISIPRSRSVTGVALPSPRMVSANVHIDVSHLSNRHTLMLMQYSQFVDHDITFTPVHKGPEGKILNCRDCDSARGTHPECWPITMPQGDSFYPAMNLETRRAYCMPFTRSLPGQQRLGPREQINQNSAYLDSSQIYGENLCKSNSLRAPGGKLNVTGHPVHGAKPLMPQITFLKECKSSSGYCFYAGDPRASEQPALAAVHTVFLRAHNHWADAMHSINAHWNDDRIYEEVRRIMIAVNQHIIYSEVLPRLLGNAMVNAYGLGLQSDGYFSGYDPNCQANIYNEFAAAAFRFGHSLVRPNLARMDNRYNGMSPHIPLRDGFFNSDMLYHPLMVDELIRGLIGEPMEQLDPFVSKEITNHLFEDKKKQFSGMDLISLNIHRGRDHGISGYNNYREVCSLKRAITFQDLSGEIPQDVLLKLKETYASVDDIDLFTGSISERPIQGGLLGPTMTCIIATQFKRLRHCDRYWYETSDPALRFTPQQLAEIRKITMSKIVCDNLDMPGEIQKSSFDAPHNVLNPRIPCDRLPALNLEAWREPPPQVRSQVHVRQCNIGGKVVDVGGSGLPSPCVSCVCTPEGTRCASLRITSCQRLFEEARREDIAKDNICMSQCGFLMNGDHGRSQHPNSIFNFGSRSASPFSRSHA